MRHETRKPAVAGRFYPEDAEALEAVVRGFLDDAPAPGGPAPRALVAPHAGYPYSGPVAGSAWALARGSGDPWTRVVLLGPSHFHAFPGLALPEARAFATPLGHHQVDHAAAALAGDALVLRSDRIHREEHSLEVHLPFIRVALGPLPVIPLLTGRVEPREVAEVLEGLWTPETLVVVSSDLSHYLPYEEARLRDRRTAELVEALAPETLSQEMACGATGLGGLLAWARRRGLGARCVDLRSSGDTAGSRRRVVGYGAFGFWENAREA